MKRFIYLLTFISLVFHSSVYSQDSCQTAIKDEGIYQVPLTAVGTTAPTGPDYGCLTMFSRPFFGYFISCDTTSFNPRFILDQPASSAEFSLVIWGPFTNRNDACNNLTSANIQLCLDLVSGNDLFFSLPVFYALPGEFYYYMLSTTDTTVNNTYSGMHAISQPGVGNQYFCFDCNGEVSMLFKRDLCLVTFDSASQKTKLIWEKVPNAGVDGYTIYRGIQGSSLADSIAYVSETLAGEFIDFDSHPFQYGEHYRLQPVDSCGQKHNEYTYLMNYTCFLQANPAGNNTVNLSWNQFAINQQEFEPVQYIYRGSSQQNMQIIDTVPYGLNLYTDITAPPGQQYYSIERRRYSACNPLRVTSNSIYESAMSNHSGATVTGIPVIDDANYLQVYPVPTKGILNIKTKKEMAGSKLTILDMNARPVFTDFISNNNEFIDISHLPPGTYWLCITGNVRLVKKIIISR